MATYIVEEDGAELRGNLEPMRAVLLDHIHQLHNMPPHTGNTMQSEHQDIEARSRFSTLFQKKGQSCTKASR